MTTTEATNQEILKARLEAFNKKTGPRVGDFLRIGDFYTRFTHNHGETIQTGGHESSSYYLGNGYASYSGGLDPGVKTSDLILTQEEKEGSVWFFSNDWAKADNGVYFKIPFRVYTIKEGANLSGLYGYESHLKNKELEKVPEITMINGNGQEYKKKLPEILILTDFINDGGLEWIEKNTGLKFIKGGWGYSVQPMESEQIVKLMLTYNFSSTYYNNATYKNVMHLKFNK